MKRGRPEIKTNVIGTNPKILDQYFTKPEVATFCVMDHLLPMISLDTFSDIVEPSCGEGAFLSALDQYTGNLIYFDIDAQDEEHRKDFMTFDMQHINGTIMTIGNPPFSGKTGALQFFNHAAKYSDVIAFILPRSFRKISVVKKMDKRFHLLYEHILDKDSFIFCGKSYPVPCVWQIWAKTSAFQYFRNVTIPTLEIRLDTTQKYVVKDFEFVKRDSPGSFHIVIQRVGQRAGRVFLEVDRFKEKTTTDENFFYLRICEGYDIEQIGQRLIDLNLENDESKFDTASSHYSISKSRIIERYYKYISQ